MKTAGLALLMLALLAGCAPAVGLTSTLVSTSPPTLTPESSSPQVPTPIQPATPFEITRTSGAFSLHILSPADQAVVSEPSMEVRGEVSDDAVLTINDDIYILPPGNFVETIALEEGPNVLQIVASDWYGNEVDLVITVIYQP